MPANLGAGGLARRFLVLAAVAAFVLLFPLGSDSYANDAAKATIFAIVGLSMNVLVGYTGQISLGHQAFVGLGALTAANVANTGTSLADPFSLGYSMVAAAVIPGVVALLLGAIALRITGLYLALVTLVFGTVMADAIFTLNSLNGRAAGKPAFRPDILASNYRFYLFGLVILALVTYVDFWITRTKVGRGLIALRDDERVAQSFGVNVLAYKLLGFSVSGAMAGLAGGVFAFWTQQFSDKDFTSTAGFNFALIFVVMVVVGGLGNRVGVIIASAFFAVLDPLLAGIFDKLGASNFYIDHKFYLTSLIGATLLLQTVIMNPGGLGQAIGPVTRWLGGARFSMRHHDAAAVTQTQTTASVRA
ncbi:MAG: branched-chain amino acid ABC transporter permease [Actinomycetes bacterium]